MTNQTTENTNNNGFASIREEYEKQLGPDPSNQDLARVLLDLVSISETNFQSNISSSTLIGTLVEVIIQKGLIGEEDFFKLVEENMKRLDSELIAQSQQAVKDFEEAAKQQNQEEPTEE